MAVKWEHAIILFATGPGHNRIVHFSHRPVWDKVPDDLPGVLKWAGDDGWEVVSFEGDYWPEQKYQSGMKMRIVLKRLQG
jgi:hypothetical protein